MTPVALAAAIGEAVSSSMAPVVAAMTTARTPHSSGGDQHRDRDRDGGGGGGGGMDGAGGGGGGGGGGGDHVGDDSGRGGSGGAFGMSPSALFQELKSGYIGIGRSQGQRYAVRAVARSNRDHHVTTRTQAVASARDGATAAAAVQVAMQASADDDEEDADVAPPPWWHELEVAGVSKASIEALRTLLASDEEVRTASTDAETWSKAIMGIPLQDRIPAFSARQAIAQRVSDTSS